MDFIKEALFFLKRIFEKEKFTYQRARLLNHTVLEVLFLREDGLWSTVVTGDYRGMYKEYGKEDLPRNVFDSTQGEAVIREYKCNWVAK